MIVRALDINNDWTFGRGKNNYKSNVDAVAQNVQTRLMSFLGDCFFKTDDGIDWFNLLGSKNRLELELAINATILNTENITGLIAVSSILNENRLISISYRAQSSFGTVDEIFQYDVGV